MDTIELNGKKYISFDDYNLLLEENNLLLEEKEKKKSLYQSKINIDCMMMDETNVSAIGTVELTTGDWHQTKISTAFLERVIKGLKAMSFRKEGLDTISLVWTKDHPVIIGNLQNVKNKTFVAGYIIAPRIEPE